MDSSSCSGLLKTVFGLKATTCDPTKEDFGFHLFEIRCTKRKGNLLPYVNFPYYLLGDLNSPGADMLPNYIKEHNTGQQDDSSADRIIVTAHRQWRFGKIYVTTHKDQSSFDPCASFHISRRLLKIIKSFPNLDVFLLNTGYQKPAFQMLKLSLTYAECVCSCTIL